MASPTPSPSSRSSSAVIAEQAAAWVAKRDRGLSAAEQDEYMQWLGADARHVDAVSQQAAAFGRMMTLYEWQPGASAEPNPHLFHRWQGWRRPLVAVAAAAAVILCGVFAQFGFIHSSPPPSAYLRVNERQGLPDGSVVELKDGSRLSVHFTPGERRVRLTGEALFRVAKDAERPFIVEAAGVSVRAVGTAFNVRVDSDAVEVLVTEGRVRVHPPGTTAETVAAPESSESKATLVAAQQRVVIDRTATTPPPVKEATAEAIETALSWQKPRLQFFETPLETAIAEFNQRNSRQIILSDSALKPVRIDGTFRVDNVEGFVRTVAFTLDLRTENRGNEIVLSRAR